MMLAEQQESQAALIQQKQESGCINSTKATRQINQANDILS
jgi:hypothetical protein